MEYVYVSQGIMADFCLNMTERGILVKIISFGADGFYEVELMRCPNGKTGKVQE